MEWVVPKSTFEVKGFFRKTYKKFIRNFSGICTPLDAFMRKWDFKLSTIAQHHFVFLKKKVTEKLVYVLPNIVKVFKVDCDVIGETIKVVLIK